MEVPRDFYLQRLIRAQWDGQVKVITGIRRCGKSYLLRTLFRKYLLAQGVKDEQIISLELDLTRHVRYRNPLELAQYVRERVEGKPGKFYLFIDEIQMSEPVKNPYLPAGKEITFYDALNDFREMANVDVYVTGSNSKMLSSDILTEFRGRSTEIRVHPFSFAEFYSVVGGDKNEAFDHYSFYGGMPLVLSKHDDAAKMEYLQSLFSEVYLKDIKERRQIEYGDELGQVLDLLCSSVGSLTNPSKISATIRSRNNVTISANTLKSYIGHLEDAFLFAASKRYDVKGKSYFDFPMKYYCEDVGLRNARIGFRQMEMTHIMENIVHNELIARGFAVDVGVVYAREKNKSGNLVKVAKEIDFVAAKGNRRVYIQSAYAMATEEKAVSELRPLSLTGDSFPKIMVRKDISKAWYDDHGILNVGIIEFLLDPSVLG